MVDPSRALTFGQVADEYDRWRPHYPDAAVDWLAPTAPVRVADVGAGTGRLTSELLSRGHDVEAVEPDPAMRAVLARNNPAARCHGSDATAIPVEDWEFALAGAPDTYDRDTKGGPDGVKKRLPLAGEDELAFAAFDWVWDLTPEYRTANLATTSMAIAMPSTEREEFLRAARAEWQAVCAAAAWSSMPIRHQASCTRWTPRSRG